MKFGVRLPHYCQIADDPRAAGENVRSTARLAEDLGFDSIWVGDHIVPGQASAAQFGNAWYEAMTTLTFAAAVTDRVRLGTSILVVPYRHPVLLAKMLSTLDVLSGGRVDAGIGVGWFEQEFQALGIGTHFAPRGTVTDEYLHVMKALWTGKPCEFRGEYVQVDTEGLMFDPVPLQPGGIPIWVGGNSKRAARRLAEFGDVWQLVRPTLDQFRLAIDEAHRQCDKSGRDPATIEFALEHPFGVVDSQRSRNVALVASPDQILTMIGQFTDLGAKYWLLDMYYSAPELESVQMEELVESMHRFAEEIRPHVQ